MCTLLWKKKKTCCASKPVFVSTFFFFFFLNGKSPTHVTSLCILLKKCYNQYKHILWAQLDNLSKNQGNIIQGSSLHNIILITFRVILVLWRLLETGLSFSFLRHSCSKKFLWRLKVLIVWVDCLSKNMCKRRRDSVLERKNKVSSRTFSFQKNDITSPQEPFWTTMA